MSNETTQINYSMNRVGRIVSPNRQILRDISIGFYLGAKIGVLGLNGADIPLHPQIGMYQR